MILDVLSLGRAEWKPWSDRFDGLALLKKRAADLCNRLHDQHPNLGSRSPRKGVLFVHADSHRGFGCSCLIRRRSGLPADQPLLF